MNRNSIWSLALVIFILCGLLLIPCQVGAENPKLTTSDMGTGLTAADLVANLINPATVSYVDGSATYNGADDAAGIFSTTQDGNVIGFSDGIVLSTGDIGSVVSSNNYDGTTTNNGWGGDNDLRDLAGASISDAAILEFDFIPKTNVITFQYVFGSEEYNEWVNGSYNDVFGFFVNYENRAVIPGTDTPVTVNSVNSSVNSAYYRNNDLYTGLGINTELDGLTVVMTVMAHVDCNQQNHIKIAIGDAGDTQNDSDVFIKMGSFDAVTPTLMSYDESDPSQVFFNKTNEVGYTNYLKASVFKSDGTGSSDAPVTFKVVSGPSVGTISSPITTDGNGEALWSYSYTGNVAGTDIIVAYIPDTLGTLVPSNNVYQDWTIPSDLTPAANPDEFFMDQGTTLTGNVMTNDNQGDQPAKVTSLYQAASFGQVTLDSSGNGVFTYTPLATHYGSDIFKYWLVDGDGDKAIGTVTIYISAVNHNPVAVFDSAETVEGQAVTIYVLNNDSDPDQNNSISIKSVSTPGHGSATIDGTSIIYTPNAGFTGSDTFTYTITDSQDPEGTATATVSVSVVALVRYTLTAICSDGGTILPEGPNVVNKGESFTFNITLATGYHIVSITDNDNPATVTTPTTYVISNVTADHTVVVTFAINTYTLSYKAGTGGSITGNGYQTVNYGAAGSEVTAVPNNGYHFVNWDDGVTTATRTDANVTAEITVTANFAINTYTLSYTSGFGGTITGTSPQIVVYSADGVAVTAVPDTGYHFVNWSDGVTTAARTDTNVTADISVTANFAINTYTLTYTAGSGGSIIGNSSQTVDYNTNGSEVTAVPNEGYHFVDWSDAVTAAARTDANVTANINVTANFTINTYTLTYMAGSGGSIIGNSSQTVDYNTNGSEVTAVPNEGYHFVDWSDGVTTAVRADTNVTTNMSVTADFAINTYTLTYTAGPNGSITGASPQTVDYGKDGSVVTAVPDTGYHFVDWSDGVTTAVRADTNVTTNMSVTANFAINTYTLSYIAGSGGSITGTNPQTVNYGADGSVVTAVPGTGYHFVDWNDNSNQNPRTDVSVKADINVTANFAIDTFTITASAGENGSIDPYGLLTVNYGTNQSFAITPAAGYHVATVLVDGTSVGGQTTYTFTNVTKNHTIEASFAVNAGSFIITASAGSGGTISPSGDVTVEYGTNQSFSITPDTGYHVVSVLVDGSSVEAATGYTFTNVTADHTISVSFAIDTYTITASAGDNGTITPSGNIVVDYNGSITFNVTANTGYHVMDVVVDGEPVGAVTTYTLSNIASGHTIIATFAQDLVPWVATIDFDPDTLNLHSADQCGYSKWVTVYIEASNGWDVKDIDGSTVLLNGTVPAYMGKEGWAKPGANCSNMMDHDRDGKLERMVKFDRASVVAILSVGDQVKVTVTGKAAGMDFEGYGYDIIRVINEGYHERNLNHPPVANDDLVSTTMNTPVTINVLTNDTDADNDTLGIIRVAKPWHGSVTNNSTGITYTPVTGWSGTDYFRYTITDGKGGYDTARVTVTVSAGSVNHPPVAVDDSANTSINKYVKITVLDNDTDVDHDNLSVTSVTQPSQGTAQIYGAYVKYTPNTNSSGTDTFTYTVSDGKGGTDEGKVTVIVGSGSVNHMPVAVDDLASTSINKYVKIDVLDNDTDADHNTLSVTSVTQPTNGTVTIGDSYVKYTPKTNWSGTDTFTYVISDGKGGTDEGKVTVTVGSGSVNHMPVAVDDLASTRINKYVKIDVLDNDTDADHNTLSVTLVTQPTNGTVKISDSYVKYTPKTNWSGMDTFTYTVSDGKGGTCNATVTVNVSNSY